jgi:homoserine/homoserine lactone efflux protein
MAAKAVPVLLAVSLTPGLCMMLALTLGATIGVRRTLWMMIGELSGLGLVSILCITGIAAVMISRPDVYGIGRMIGGVYLLYIGLRIARTDIRALSIGSEIGHIHARPDALISRGFISAVGNPKSWLFYASLLPPFMQPDRPLLPQVTLLVLLLLLIEFMSLLLYATCGQAARRVLKNATLARAFLVIAGAVVFCFGVEIVLVR